jgi:hypothetical protein
MRLFHIFNFAALLALAACSSHSGRRTAADSNPSGIDLPSGRQVDVVVASHEGLHVWFGQGRGRFQASAQGFLTLPSTTGVALGDLDGDGDLDLFVTRYEKHPNQVWFNDGSGRFRDSGQTLGEAECWRVALGDLDRDGDLDAFVIGTFNTFTSPGVGQPHEVWLNNGKGVLTTSGQRLGGTGGYDACLTDLDADGDLDAVVVDLGGIAIWINQGNARFREQGPRLSAGSEKDCRGLAVGDLDGDGDLDILLARLSQCEVWTNRGRGQFDAGQILAAGLPSISVALGDLDGDGDLDAFLGTRAEHPNRVLVNNGKGQFADTGQALAAGYTLDVALVDCDGDGDLDAIQANRNSPNRLLLNNGQGHFTDSGRNLGNLMGSWKSRRIAIGSLRTLRSRE